jgi:competence protein ComEA
MFHLNERVRWFLSAAVVVLMALILLVFLNEPRTANDATILVAASSEPATPVTAVDTPATTPTPSAQVAVDVIGAVRQPGVYYVDSTARVNDAVNAAGGLAPDADREQINLAAHLTDGQQIKVPRVSEATQLGTPERASDAGGSAKQLIDINTADAALLEQLPGVGSVTAQAIIDYRTANGAFARIEDVQNVKGIGPSTFNKLKDHITVNP